MVSSRPSNSPPIRLVYRGDSMRGTFQDGDRLRIEEAPFDFLRPGDVVAFHSGDKAVVHRIARRTEAGFRTRGDASLRCDSAPLSPDHLIGMVTERDRRGVCSTVVGDARGRRRAMFLHGVCNVRVLARLLFRPAYRLLRASRLASVLWKPRILTARFVCSEGEFTKFIHRGKTVARWVPQERRWTCRKPYDLILDSPRR